MKILMQVIQTEYAFVVVDFRGSGISSWVQCCTGVLSVVAHEVSAHYRVPMCLIEQIDARITA